MTRTLRIVLYTVSAVCLLLLFMFSGSKYGWMEQIEPSLASSSIANDANNRGLFSTVVMSLLVVVQIAIAIKAPKAIERLVAVLLLVAAMFIYVT